MKSYTLFFSVFYIFFFLFTNCTTTSSIKYSGELKPPEYWINEAFSYLKNKQNNKSFYGSNIKKEKCLYYKYEPKNLKEYKNTGYYALSKKFFQELDYFQFGVDSIKIPYYKTLDSIDFDKIYTPYSEERINIEHIDFFSNTCKKRMTLSLKTMEELKSEKSIYYISKPYFSEDHKFMFMQIEKQVLPYVDSVTVYVYLFRVNNKIIKDLVCTNYYWLS